MAMIRNTFFVLVSLALSAAVSSAAERPALRADVTVTGGVVRIGDLIENAGIVADVPVFRAPALGQTGTIAAAQVLDAVRAHALVGIDPGPISEVTVTRASRSISAAEIESLVATALTKSYALGNAGDVSVTFTRPLRTLHLESTQTGTPQIEQLRFDARSGRFDGTLTIAATQMRLVGTAVVTSETVELLRPIARGEVIKMSDLTMRRVPRAQVTRGTITDPDQAVGMAARGAINAGRMLQMSELMKPELVQRNESVTIVYQTPGLMLAVRGKAGDGGAEGDMIDVVNLQSNRTVRATVIGRGQVAVAPMTARIVASAENPSNLSQAKAGANRE
jgi:flagella basal body P-ring formation protein FlgA